MPFCYYRKPLIFIVIVMEMASKAKTKEKKEESKKNDGDQFEEAYDAILEYHKDYKYDQNNGPYYTED